MRRSDGLHKRLGLGATLAACLLAVVMTTGCGKKEATPEKPASTGIEKVYERGPIKVTETIDRSEISIADTMELVLKADVEEGYEVEMPKFGEKLEQFGIVDFRETPPVLGEGGRVTMTRTYKLEPFLSGEYTVPAMTIKFKKSDETEQHEVETEALKVTVKSLLPEDQANLQIKPIAGPVELPRTDRWWPYAVLGAILLAVACGAAVYLWRRRHRATAAAAPRIPAHELAFQQIEALLAEDLIGKGEYKLFYIRISDILRRYLENQFGLHAPERTTEEFLFELRYSSALAVEHRKLLGEFLNHCDLVKFAEHQPATAEIQQTFDTCKQFILDTEAARAARIQAAGA